MATPSRRIIILISCPDQPGIVAAISHFIYTNAGNIVESNQHSTALNHGQFYWRLCIAEDGFALSRAQLHEAFASLARPFQMEWSIHYSSERKRAAILVSQLDHCLIDLLWRWDNGEIYLDIPCIISNHPTLEPIAQRYHIPFAYVPITPGQRADDQARMLDYLADKVDFLILARYMQILEPSFIQAYPQQIINIHHSFLPAFIGARPYVQAFERGVKLIGATAHFVTEQLDEGPIIAQDVIHCDHRDTIHDFIRKGRDIERTVLAQAIHLYAEDRVLLNGNKTIVF